MDQYYVKTKPTTNLYRRSSGNDVISELLWGDLVHSASVSSGGSSRIKVHARGETGWVKKSNLRKKTNSYRGLLEVYVIDVGQGDGVLFRTLDDKWHLVDAGVANFAQMTKKGAANFLRWKFYEDLRQDRISLHSLTATHPDFDHFGGMTDLLSEKLSDGRQFKVEVENFYHCGMGRFDGDKAKCLGKTEPGRVAPFPYQARGTSRDGKFITELLDDIDSFKNPSRRLTKSFSSLARLVARKCNHAKRLSMQDQYLDGYGSREEVSIRILGPIVEEFGNNKQGLRILEPDSYWESKTRNGHSVVYRIDCGKARVLLTGDLNDSSQRLMLSYVSGREFACDVAKGCHHGSEDINVDFVKAMKSRATVISSGDNESYAHPRPIVMGASGKYGREPISLKNEKMAPLVYSTEVSRSANLHHATEVVIGNKKTPAKEVTAGYRVKRGSGYESKEKPLEDTPLVTDVIYGLVNVRTDGETILCATMLESGKAFDTKMFQAGVTSVRRR